MPSSPRCPQCGTINFIGSVACRRCDAPLPVDVAPVQETATAPPPRQHTIAQRVAVLTLIIVGILLADRTSLTLTSEAVDAAQAQTVRAAIDVLRSHGFSREVFVLEHLTSYRTTDNWWNEYVGHSDAYAATNFPFEVVTLYPKFFRTPADDTERAIILFHEAQHLFGHGEEVALDRVWMAKARIGWTADKYEGTRLWRNTREWTAQSAPQLFTCGSQRTSDCAE